MQGVPDNDELRGLIPRFTIRLFDRIAQEKEKDANKLFLITCSYFEIYNEVVSDLLDPSSKKKGSSSGLDVKEHPVLGVYVKGLQEIVVEGHQKMQQLITQGMGNRHVAATKMNEESSRSHSVFTIKIHQKDKTDDSKSTFAKVNLVDLAGSERAKSTGASGATLKEGANINKSLSALGNVINALVESAKGKKNVFVPYRNSKLTRVLQESLGGNSLTAMLAALSPAAVNHDETLSTLKYAARAKSIKLSAKKNEEASQISKLNDEIAMLKKKLEEQAEGDGGAPGSLLSFAPDPEVESKYQNQIKEVRECECEERSDELRRRLSEISTSISRSSVRIVTSLLTPLTLSRRSWRLPCRTLGSRRRRCRRRRRPRGRSSSAWRRRPRRKPEKKRKRGGNSWRRRTTSSCRCATLATPQWGCRVPLTG